MAAPGFANTFRSPRRRGFSRGLPLERERTRPRPGLCHRVGQRSVRPQHRRTAGGGGRRPRRRRRRCNRVTLALRALGVPEETLARPRHAASGSGSRPTLPPPRRRSHSSGARTCASGTTSAAPSGGGDPGRLSTPTATSATSRRRVTSPARATQASPCRVPRSSPGGALALLRYASARTLHVPRLSLERNHGPRLERPLPARTPRAEDRRNDAGAG